MRVLRYLNTILLGIALCLAPCAQQPPPQSAKRAPVVIAAPNIPNLDGQLKVLHKHLTTYKVDPAYLAQQKKAHVPKGTFQVIVPKHLKTSLFYKASGILERTKVTTSILKKEGAITDSNVLAWFSGHGPAIDNIRASEPYADQRWTLENKVPGDFIVLNVYLTGNYRSRGLPEISIGHPLEAQWYWDISQVAMEKSKKLLPLSISDIGWVLITCPDYQKKWLPSCRLVSLAEDFLPSDYRRKKRGEIPEEAWLKNKLFFGNMRDSNLLPHVTGLSTTNVSDNAATTFPLIAQL